MGIAERSNRPFGAYPGGMPTGLPITLPSAKDLTDFCRRSKIQELGIFGHVFDADFAEDATVEVLVHFRQGQFVLPELSRLDLALGTMLQRSVKVMERAQVDASFNPILRQRLSKSLKVLYREF
jgi:predicted nucleotidyltransferase